MIPLALQTNQQGRHKPKALLQSLRHRCRHTEDIDLKARTPSSIPRMASDYEDLLRLLPGLGFQAVKLITWLMNG
jgi:hypothetical protein